MQITRRKQPVGTPQICILRVIAMERPVFAALNGEKRISRKRKSGVARRALCAATSDDHHETGGIHNPYPAKRVEREQVGVATDNVVGSAGDCDFEELVVVWIAASAKALGNAYTIRLLLQPEQKGAYIALHEPR